MKQTRQTTLLAALLSALFAAAASAEGGRECPVSFSSFDGTAVEGTAQPGFRLSVPHNVQVAIVEDYVVRVSSASSGSDYWQQRMLRSDLGETTELDLSRPRMPSHSSWRSVEQDPGAPEEGLVNPGWFRIVFRYIADLSTSRDPVITVCTAVSPAFEEKDAIVRMTLEGEAP